MAAHPTPDLLTAGPAVADPHDADLASRAAGLPAQGDEEACLAFLWRLRHAPDGEHAYCPRCERFRVFRRYQTTESRKSWTCRRCGLHLHPTAGTMFEKSSTSLRTWFSAMELLIGSNGDISAADLQRRLGIGYRAARRIKALVATALEGRAEAFERMSADERFVLAVRLCAAPAYPLQSSAVPDDQAQPPGRDVARSRISPPGGPMGQLPVGLDRFVGRQRETMAILRLIRRNRLVTLSGDGGCGKTRLAMEVAGRDAGRFTDGVSWIDLARVDRNDSVAIAAAEALRIYDQPHRSHAAALAEHLRDRSMLVVVDNCEHVLDGCAEVIVPVLKACPAIRVLATSREPLRVDGEVVWRVPSLATPDLAEASGEGSGRSPSWAGNAGGSWEPPPGLAFSPEAVLRFDAVALFAERAKAARSSFTLTRENVAAVIRVCQQLDGIPLAIELAAAQVSAFTAQQIAVTQEDSFAWPAGPRRSAPPRQRTLEASMDWSYELLDDDERAVLRRLAVFPASFSAEAAREVCAEAGVAGDHVLPVLFRLVDKSLVGVEEHVSAHRYRLLQTVRQYAMRRLAQAGELDQTRTRHLSHAVGLAERAGPGSPAEGQHECLDILDVERASLRTALDWSIEQGDADSALRLACGLALFYATRGHTIEAQRWFADALGADQPPPVPSAARAMALSAAAFVDLNASDAAAAHEKAIAALDMARAVGDLRAAARAHDVLGLMHVNANPAQARIHLEETADIARGLGDDWCLGHALQLMAWSWTMQGALEPARRERARSLEFVRPLGNPFFMAWHWLGVALDARRTGDLAEGRAAVTRALAAATDAGDPLCHAWAALCDAELGSLSGHASSARRSLSQLDARLRLSAVSPTTCALIHTAQATCALALAKLAEAEQHLEVAIDLGRGGPSLAIQGERLIALADIAVLHDQIPRARLLAEDIADCAAQLGNRWLAASAEVIRGRCSLSEGDLDSARSVCQQALAVQAEEGYWADALPTLDVIADIYTRREIYPQAARLHGAADAARRRLGIRPSRVDSLRYGPDRERLARAIDSQTLRGYLAEGSKLSLTEAIDYASRGWGSRNRPQAGWDSLTTTELTVVRLLSDGMTNAAIARKMMIAEGTVKAHVSHVFTKLGVSHRAEVAAVAARRLAATPTDAGP